ncbi:hypothetical protein BH09ACT10_BH09ACT10_23660 [soil metagenome]
MCGYEHKRRVNRTFDQGPNSKVDGLGVSQIWHKPHNYPCVQRLTNLGFQSQIFRVVHQDDSRRFYAFRSKQIDCLQDRREVLVMNDDTSHIRQAHDVELPRERFFNRHNTPTG